MTHPYMTVSAASKRWGLSHTHIIAMCKAGRIPGACTAATAKSHIWLIPITADKPQAGKVGRPRKEKES